MFTINRLELAKAKDHRRVKDQCSEQQKAAAGVWVNRQRLSLNMDIFRYMDTVWT
jgi:hypothetical protein